MHNSTSIIVVDDHSIFRKGVVQTLEMSSDLEIVGEGGSASDALELVEQLRPAVALLDVSMPGDGIDAASRIHAGWPDVKIVMLTVSEAVDDVLRALDAGVSGYVTKGVKANDLISIVTSIAGGETYVSPSLGIKLMSGVRTPGNTNSASLIDTLSPKEEITLKLVGKGLSNSEIARRMGVQVKTIKFHMSNLFTKLEIRNRVEAALLAQKHFGSSEIDLAASETKSTKTIQ